jgi:hypothetical protein
MNGDKPITLLPDQSLYPAATEITPQQIAEATGEERQLLVEQQLEQLRQLYNRRFHERMLNSGRKS